MRRYEDLEVSEIILQIITSIRNLDGRIDELKCCLLAGNFQLTVKETIKQRIFRLLETRMCLVHSLMDQKLSFDDFLGEETEIGYKSIKRQIEEI